MPVILMGFRQRVVLATSLAGPTARARPLPHLPYGPYQRTGGGVLQMSPPALGLSFCPLFVSGGVIVIHPLLLPQRARASRPRNRTRASKAVTAAGPPAFGAGDGARIPVRATATTGETAMTHRKVSPNPHLEDTGASYDLGIAERRCHPETCGGHP